MTTERERFEAWLEAVRDKADPGDWLFSKREAAWKAWQAALSAPPDTESRRAQPAAPSDEVAAVLRYCRAVQQEGTVNERVVAQTVARMLAKPPDAAPSVAPEPPTREALAEIVRSHLTSTYHCTRVWEAWHVGTMTEDDFEPASESDMAEEIADAILAAYPPQAHSVAP